MDYKKLAGSILSLVGSESNIINVSHCATRLRFVLKDTKKANEEKIKEEKGVASVVKSGGQFQVVIGNDVNLVYNEIIKLGTFIEDDSDTGEKKGITNHILDFITGSFTPILPAITGAGMIKAILTLLTAFNILDTDNINYKILEIFSDGAFYFLPIMLAYTSAVKLRANPYIAMGIVGILLHPNLAALFGENAYIHLFGLPIRNVSYRASVIPILLTVFFMSYVEKLAEKVLPKAIKFFLKLVDCLEKCLIYRHIRRFAD